MKVLRPKFDANGLVPVIVQDAKNLRVPMLAYANEEAYLLTLKTGLATFWSRSRGKIWVKGEESGNLMPMVGLPLIDCDGDALIYFVMPAGPACHTNQETCFYRSVSSVDKAQFPSEKEALEVMEAEVCI